MRILIIQSSTWAMRFYDVTITPLARAWPADLALRPRLGVYFGISWQNRLRKCTGGRKRVGLPLSLMCGLSLLGLSAIIRCIGSDRSIAVWHAVTIAIDTATACARMTSTFITFVVYFKCLGTWLPFESRSVCIKQSLVMLLSIM